MDLEAGRAAEGREAAVPEAGNRHPVRAGGQGQTQTGKIAQKAQ